MIADLGLAAIFIALALSLYSVLAAIYSAKGTMPTAARIRWVESARNALFIIFPLLFIASGAVVWALWTNDFSLEYAASVTSIDTPKYLKVTALWGGQRGSLLFWNLLLAAFTAAAMKRDWSHERELMPWVIMIMAITQLFFLILTVFLENPFARMAVVPPDGRGLNPMLRHVGMIIHPPMLYLGFVGFTIPYAYAMAALITNRVDDAWIRITRRWGLVSWLFLSAGLILGSRWAYDVLGWGGYWAWDPVENASFMPWLAGTAFLHSVMIQEKRGQMFRMWNMILMVLTFLLVISGTFIVRSGVISSIHSFAESNIGWYFLAFIIFIFLFSAYWINKRYDQLASDIHIKSWYSREAAFLYNNYLFMAILAVVTLGTYFPIISEMFGDKITVGPPFYEKVSGPLFLLLVLLMGVAPLAGWGVSSIKRIGKSVRYPAIIATLGVVIMFVLGFTLPLSLIAFWVIFFSTILTLTEFGRGIRARMRRGENPIAAFTSLVNRNRRRYGGYMVHLGVLIIAFGIIGIEFFPLETQQQLKTGESIELGRFTMTFRGLDQYKSDDDLIVTRATADVYLGDKLVKTIHPRNEYFQRTGQTMTIPDARSTAADDFYLRLVSWDPQRSDTATLRAYVFPLVNWIWMGGIMFTIGTMVSLWPNPVEERAIEALRAKRRWAPATD